MNLRNKVVLITGGAKRIGKALVETFAEHGARVAFTYRQSSKEAKVLTRKLQSRGLHVESYRSELGVLRDVQRVLKKIEQTWGGVDILINSASDFYPTPFKKITEKNWDYFMRVNLKGSFLYAWQAGLQMKKKGAGKIINLADWAADRPMKNYLPYSVSKTGVVGLTKALAVELAPEVCVNAIAPGPVLPPDKTSARQKQALAKSVPLLRIGSPSDIAEAALFLIEQTDYITGTVLNVDGGRLLL